MLATLRRGFSWLYSLELSVLLAALALVGGTLAFVQLADEVREQDTQSFDDRLIVALRDPGDQARPVGPPWLAEAGRDLTALGGVTTLTLATGAVAGFLLMQGGYRQMWLVVLATAGGLVLSMLLKGLFERPRPELVPHLSQVYTSSFPSGHSMLSAVVYLTLGTLLCRLTPRRPLKIYILTAAMTVTILVGVSRVYMGVHYPTDVLAGWLAGLAWAMLCYLAAWYLQRKQAMPATTEGEKAG